MRTGSAAIAPRIAARWEIDLSVGGRSSPRRRVGGVDAHDAHAITAKPSPATSAAASSARASGTHRAISPWLLSGRRAEGHVGDVDARARRA